MESVLFKKASKGLSGFHIWQRRFFAFDPSAEVLRYYTEEQHSASSSHTDSDIRGEIPLDSIVEVRWFKKKKAGKRFDLVIESDEECRTISLLAQSRASAREWVHILTGFISHKRTVEETESLIRRTDLVGTRSAVQRKHSVATGSKGVRSLSTHTSQESKRSSTQFDGGKRNLKEPEESLARENPEDLGILQELRFGKRENMSQFSENDDSSSSFSMGFIKLQERFPREQALAEKLERRRTEMLRSMSSSRRTSFWNLKKDSPFHSWKQTFEQASSSTKDPAKKEPSQYLLKNIKDIISMNERLLHALHHAENPDDNSKDVNTENSSSNSTAVTNIQSSEEQSFSQSAVRRGKVVKGETKEFDRSLSAGYFSALVDLSNSKNDMNGHGDKNSKLFRIDTLLRDFNGKIKPSIFIKNYKIYSSTFTGYQLISLLLSNQIAETIASASELIVQLNDLGWIRKVDGFPDALLNSNYSRFTLSSNVERSISLKDNDYELYLWYWLCLMRDQRTGIKLHSMKKGLRTKNNRFTGLEGINWLLENKAVSSRDEAFKFIQLLLRKNILWAAENQEWIPGIEKDFELRFNKDMQDLADELQVRKQSTSSSFKSFIDLFISDELLLIALLEEHLRQISTDAIIVQHRKRSSQSARRSTLSVANARCIRESCPAISLNGEKEPLSVDQKSEFIASGSSSASANSRQRDKRSFSLHFLSKITRSTNYRVQHKRNTSSSSNGVKNDGIKKLLDIVPNAMGDLQLTDSENEDEEVDLNDPAFSPSLDSLLNSSEIKSRSGSPRAASKSALNGRSKSTDSESIDLRHELETLYRLLIIFTVNLPDRLREVCLTDDKESHALALDLFLEILRLQSLQSHVCRDPFSCLDCQFVDNTLKIFVDQFCSGKRYSEPIKESLLAMLMDSSWSRVKVIPFNQKVKRPGVWPSIFKSLQGAEMSLRFETLKDVMALMMTRSDNALDICRYPDWQIWIIPFCFAEFDDFQRNASLAINIISLVHLHAFGSPEHAFLDILCRSLELFREYEVRIIRGSSGSGTSLSKDVEKKIIRRCESLSIARWFLELLCLKIQDKTSMFPLTPNPDSIYWQNLLDLVYCVTIFLFNTPKWNVLTHEDDGIHGGIRWIQIVNDGKTKLLSKYRLHYQPTAKGCTWVSDFSLVQRMFGLMTSLRLDRLDVDSDLEMGHRQREFITTVREFFDLYKDMLSFFEILKEFEDIFEWNKVKMGNLCKEFMTKDPSKRSEWISALCLQKPTK